MDLMLDLPFDVLRVGIFPLLKEHDMCSLDIAVSSQPLRDILWEALRFSQFSEWTKYLSLPKLGWLHSRGIRLRCIDSLDGMLVRNEEMEVLLHLIQKVCPSPQRLNFDRKRRRCVFRDPLSFDCALLYPLCGQHLTSFHLSNCSNITKRALTKILRNSPNLQRINLTRSTVSSRVVSALSKFPQLTALDLTECYRGVTDASITAIAKNCPLLSSLCVYESRNLTDNAIECVANHCTSLTKLDLRSCHCISDVSLCAIADRCPLLTSLGVGSAHCCDITDIGVISIAYKLPLLSKLFLGLCKITDSSILALAEKCPLLTNLVLTGNSKIADATMIALSRRCPLTHIRFTGSCSLLTGAGLVNMSQNLSDLVELHLVGCHYVTDSILTALAQNLLRLVSLSLQICNRVSHVGLVAVADNCRLLSNLDVSFSNMLVGYGAMDGLIACIGHFSSALTCINVGISAFQVRVNEEQGGFGSDDSDQDHIAFIQMLFPQLNIIQDYAIFADTHFSARVLNIDD